MCRAWVYVHVRASINAPFPLASICPYLLIAIEGGKREREMLDSYGSALVVSTVELRTVNMEYGKFSDRLNLFYVATSRGHVAMSQLSI